MNIRHIFMTIAAVLLTSAVFADSSSVTSKKYVDDFMAGYQNKIPGSGADKLMIYDDTDGIGAKQIVSSLGDDTSATNIPDVGAVKDALDDKQDKFNGTEGYVMTGTGTAGEVGERAIYSASTNYSDALVTAEAVNTAVTNAVNNSLIRVNENGNSDANGTLWQIVDYLPEIYVHPHLPDGFTKLQFIESSGTQYIDTGIETSTSNTTVTRFEGVAAYTAATAASRNFIAAYSNMQYAHYCEFKINKFGANVNSGAGYFSPTLSAGTPYNVSMQINGSENTVLGINVDGKEYVYKATTYQSSTMGKFLLFRLNSEYKSAGVRIYNARVKVNDVLLFEGVPAQRDSDNAIGMYNLADPNPATAFRTNAGTGNFIAGPAVGN